MLANFHESSIDETMEIRGNNPMLSSKLYILLNVNICLWHAHYKNNSDKTVIGIAQLSLSAVLKMQE